MSAAVQEKKMVKPIGEIIEGPFTRTYDYSGFRPDEITLVGDRRFACDNYQKLYETVLRGRKDAIHFFEEAIKRRVVAIPGAMQNQTIADLIAEIRIPMEYMGPGVCRVIFVEGAWRFNPRFEKGM